MEIIFNLGEGLWQTAVGKNFITTPPIELWGQVVQPLAIRSIGRNTMLGIRFLPHAGTYFIRENIDQLNNQVVDLKEFSPDDARILHDRLLDNRDWEQRIALMEEFLLRKLVANRQDDKKTMVKSIMQEIGQEDFFDNMDAVASRYGISSRYLRKLFLRHTGLTPKLYNKIHRFQNSLKLIAKKDASLTSIAYACGYFDQSHFIREFKSFTGITPSNYSAEKSPITFAFSNG
jgi:AraC-like DNA-binding protein